jgi:hypothetical protein
MNVGILGSGDVAKTLAAGFQKHGHDVSMGTRSPQKLEEWAQENLVNRVGSFRDAADFGDVLVLAVKGQASSDVLRQAGTDKLAGKTVIDVTNPISDKPPVNGVLNFFTSLDSSLMEMLQQEFPQASFVKAFNSVGCACMVDPSFEEGQPTMFICGNDKESKVAVGMILEEFGWGVADMGMAEAARAIEPLCMLWCIPGFLHNDWRHAFKLLTIS